MSSRRVIEDKGKQRHVEVSSRRAIEDKSKAKACGNVLKKGYLRTKVRQGHLKMSSRVKINVTISDKLFPKNTHLGEYHCFVVQYYQFDTIIQYRKGVTLQC
jgi:hypothetical protein